MDTKPLHKLPAAGSIKDKFWVRYLSAFGGFFHPAFICRYSSKNLRLKQGF